MLRFVLFISLYNISYYNILSQNMAQKSINPRNLIDFMVIHDADNLKKIELAFPEAKRIFLRKEITLGTSTTDFSQLPADCLVQFADAATKKLLDRSEKILSETTRRLKLSVTLQTVGSILSAVSSAGLILSFGKVMVLGSNLVELGLALITFFSSLLSIFAEKLVGGASGGKIREYFDQVVALDLQIYKNDLHLQQLIASSSGVDAIGDLIMELNDIAIKLRTIELNMRVA